VSQVIKLDFMVVGVVDQIACVWFAVNQFDHSGFGEKGGRISVPGLIFDHVAHQVDLFVHAINLNDAIRQ
jgi:hypothetical protein